MGRSTLRRGRCAARRRTEKKSPAPVSRNAFTAFLSTLRRARSLFVVLGFGDVPCLRTLWTVYDLEFDRLTLFKGPKAVATDCGVVHEDVAATLAFNESVALSVVEPLDLACNAHRSSSLSPCISGTKKDRECLRGLDFNVAGTPLNARLSYACLQ